MAASERCDVRRSPCGLRLRVVDDLFQPGSGLLNELLRRRIKIGNDGRFEVSVTVGRAHAFDLGCRCHVAFHDHIVPAASDHPIGPKPRWLADDPLQLGKGREPGSAGGGLAVVWAPDFGEGLELGSAGGGLAVVWAPDFGVGEGCTGQDDRMCPRARGTTSVQPMLVVTNELDRFRSDTDALARRDSRFLRAAVRGPVVQPEHLEAALGLVLALTGTSMSEEGRRTLKVIELGVDPNADGSPGDTSDGSARANLLRALVASGFSAFDQSERWLDADGGDRTVTARWTQVRGNLRRDLAFIEACGVDPDVYTQIQRASLYFSSRLTPDLAPDGTRALLDAHLLVARASELVPDSHQVHLLARMDNPVLVQAEAGIDSEQLLEVLETIDRLRSPGRVIVSLTPAGDEVEELSELVGGVAAVRPGTTWVGNPTAELADPDGGAVDSATAVERTKGLSAVVGAAGSHLAGFDIEVHATRLAEAPVVLAALGHDR